MSTDQVTVTLPTFGRQSVWFADEATGLSGKAAVAVVPSAPVRFALATPASVDEGVPFVATLAAFDAFTMAEVRSSSTEWTSAAS